MRSISAGGGIADGLSISTTSPVDRVHLVRDRRRGGDEAEVELALEPLADDLHVQQAEEPAAEPEARARPTSRARR